MITQALIYKHLRRWVSTNQELYKHMGKWVSTNQELYKHLLFFSDGIGATNMHQAIFVAHPNAVCHAETPDGKFWEPAIPSQDKQQGYINTGEWLDTVIRNNFVSVKPSAEDILWSDVIPLVCFKDWKDTLKLIQKLAVKRNRLGISEYPVIMAKEDNVLVAYVTKSPYCSAKFFLYPELENFSINWHGIFNVGFLYNFVELMLDIEAPALTCSITKGDDPKLLLEAPGVWAISATYKPWEAILTDLNSMFAQYGK